MVDYGGCRDCEDQNTFHPARPFRELILEHLRPGDMYTHAYLGRVPWFDDKGMVNGFMHEARKRGVKFDVGHGGGSFWWDKAAPATRQGFWPDSISTDLHINSMMQGMKDMTNVMSKFLSLGASIKDVVEWSTSNPAQQIKREELGHIGVGAGADVAVFRLERGRFGFIDVQGGVLQGTQKLQCELTLRDGRVVWDLNGIAAQPWQMVHGRL